MTDQQLLDEIEHLAKLGSWEGNLDSKIIVLSKEMYRILEWDLHEPATFEDINSLLDEESKRRHSSALEALIVNGDPYDMELRIVTRKGTERWVHVRTKVMFDKQGKPIKYLGTTQDITERKQAEHELEQTKELFDSFLFHHVDPIALQDKDGIVININPKYEEVFGWRKEELIGLHVSNLPNVPECFLGEVKKNASHASSGESLSDFETIRVTKSGNEIPVFVSFFPIRGRNGNPLGWAAIIRDLTEQKKAQEMLHRSDKMSVIGQLAAGVAHEIRNPLTTIKGFLQLLQGNPHAVKNEYVSIMMNELVRMESIIGEMLVLAKPQAAKFAERDIKTILQEVILLLAPQAHLHGIEVVEEFPESTAIIRCEENQIKQVFINLIKNAIEAMQTNGHIRLHIDVSDSQFIHIHVIDQGVGIAPERIQRLGEPFYTTKEKGIGLGLMVSHKLLDLHGGTLSFESKQGEGTVAKVVLPCALCE